MHMDAEIIAQIEKIAAENDRTWAAQLRVAVKDWLSWQQREDRLAAQIAEKVAQADAAVGGAR
jgi:hypothetical protein